jgi:hypothetical protein
LSRLRSSRGSSPSTSTSSGQRSVVAARRPGGVLVQAPKSDIYVVMLAIALGALAIGCLLMVLILNSYGFSTKVTSVATNHQVTRLA